MGKEMIIDQTTDRSGQEIARIVQSYHMPEFVKSATIDELKGNYSTTPIDYADPVNRRFPINNPAAVCVSAAFLEENKDSFDPADVERWKSRILKKAEIFNVGPEVRRIIDEISNRDPLADLPDDHFGYVHVDESGNKIRKYPLRNKLEVKRAAEYFEKYRKDMPWEMRHTFAKRLLEAVDRTGAHVGASINSILKSSCLGLTDKRDIVNTIKKRAMQAKYSQVAWKLYEPLTKLAADISQEENIEHSDIPQQVVSMLDSIDREFGWQNRHPLPEDEVFGVTVKEGDIAFGNLIENKAVGVGYSLLDVLSKVPQDALRRALGDEDYKRSLNDYGQLDTVKMASVLSDSKRGSAFHDVVTRFGVKPFVRFMKGPVNLFEEMYDEVAVQRVARERHVV